MLHLDEEFFCSCGGLKGFVFEMGKLKKYGKAEEIRVNSFGCGERKLSLR